METALSFLTGVLRYVLPVLAVIILFTCIISLFRNRPRLHKLAQLVDQNNGSIIDIDRWETSIGKSKSNDIVLPMPNVSRFHAVIAKKRKEWVITDTFSKTGIKLNDRSVHGSAVIEDGDIITIGSIPLKFLCAEAVSASSKTQMRNEERIETKYRQCCLCGFGRRKNSQTYLFKKKRRAYRQGSKFRHTNQS